MTILIGAMVITMVIRKYLHQKRVKPPVSHMPKTIINTVKKSNPETVEQLIKLVRQKHPILNKR